MQGQTTTQAVVPANEPVRFNTLYSNDNDGISYDQNAGHFAFAAPGNYLVHWHVNVNLDNPDMLIFGIRLSDGSLITVPAYIDRGQMSGSALIAIRTPGTTMSLLNASGKPVNYDTDMGVRANIVITQVS